MGRHVYWKRIEGSGEPELYNLEADPAQRNDLHASASASEEGRARLTELDARLESYFAEYSHPDYDLWKGGSRRGPSARRDAP